MSDTGQILDVFIHYHILFDDRELKSNVSLDIIQLEHEQLNSDFSKTNSDLSQVPDSVDERYNFKSQIGNPNVRFLPIVLQSDNITRRNFTDLHEPAASSDKPYYYNDLFKTTSPIKQGFLNIYIFPRRIANQVNFYGWASQGDNRVHIAWPVFGKDTKQRGTLTHEIGHIFGLTHTFKGIPGQGVCTQIFSDVPKTSNTNWLAQPHRNTLQCSPPDIVGNPWIGLCDNVAVDKKLVLENQHTNAQGYPFSCANVEMNPNTLEHENFFNFMDYSNFRRMFTISQAQIIRNTLIRTQARFSGLGPQQPKPPIVDNNIISEPVQFRLPYHLVHTRTNQRLGLFTTGTEGISLARAVPKDDINEVVIFINVTDELFTISSRVIESTILNINHFTSGSRLTLAIENTTTNTLTYKTQLDLGDQSQFTLRTNNSQEIITTTTPFLLTLNNQQLNIDENNLNSIILGADADYWHLESVTEFQRPPFPLIINTSYALDEPPRPIKFGERYRISSINTDLEWNTQQGFFINWTPYQPGNSIIIQQSFDTTNQDQDQNQEFLRHQSLVLFRLPETSEEIQVSSNQFLIKSSPGNGATIYIDAETTSGPIHTNTPVRLQFPIIPGFKFVNHNMTNNNNVIELTEATDFLVRFIPENGLSGQEPIIDIPIEQSPINTNLKYNDLVFLQSTNTQTNEIERIGFLNNVFGWTNSEYSTEFENSPFQMRLLPIPNSNTQNAGDSIQTNDVFLLKYDEFPTYATRSDSGLFWFTTEINQASQFKLIGTDLNDIQLIHNNTHWLGKSQDGTAILTPTKSLRAISLLLLPILDPNQPPVLENPPTTGLNFYDNFNLIITNNSNLDLDLDYGFGFINSQFGYNTQPTEYFVFEIIGLNDLQTGSVNINTPFLLKYIGFSTYFQIQSWATFDKTQATQLQFIPTTTTDNMEFYLASVDNPTQRLTYINVNGDSTTSTFTIADFSTDTQSYATLHIQPVTITNIIPPVEPPQSIKGVDVLYNRPYQLLRFDIDGSSLEIGTGPNDDNANLIQWFPHGNGHPIILTALNASGVINHNTAVFINHAVTDSSLAVSEDSSPMFWNASLSGMIFIIETEDQQSVTCESRCRLRRFDTDSSYLTWSRFDNLSVCITRNDPSYSISISCMSDALAYESIPNEQQRLSARTKKQTQIQIQHSNSKPNHNNNNTIPLLQNRQPLQQSTILSFQEYSRITHVPSERLLTSGTGQGLQFLTKDIADMQESFYAFEKENTTGVLSQGDNAWIISTVFQNKAYAVGVNPGTLFFFATPATGTKLRIEGPETGEPIHSNTLLRFRIVFPNPNLRQDLFLNYDPTTTQAIIGEDSSFQFTIVDFNILNDPIPVHNILPITYQTSMRIIDRENAFSIQFADELAAGGGSFGLYFAPTRHGTSIYFQPANDINDILEKPIKHGDHVLIIHTLAERQISYDSNQNNRLDFITGIGNGLVFVIESQEPNSTNDNTLHLGDSFRFREINTGQYLTRDPLTGTIVLSTDNRYTLGIITTDVISQRNILTIDDQPSTTTTKSWYELWWLWTIIIIVLLVIILLSIFIPRIIKKKQKAK